MLFRSVRPPSTNSSKTMSASWMPCCGTADGALSIFNASWGATSTDGSTGVPRYGAMGPLANSSSGACSEVVVSEESGTDVGAATESLASFWDDAEVVVVLELDPRAVDSGSFAT